MRPKRREHFFVNNFKTFLIHQCNFICISKKILLLLLLLILLPRGTQFNFRLRGSVRSLNPLPFHIPTLQLFPFSYTSNIFQTGGIIVQHIVTLPKYGRGGLNIRRPPRKYAQIFVRGYYLFREANSFSRAKLEENCELRGADSLRSSRFRFLQAKRVKRARAFGKKEQKK